MSYLVLARRWRPQTFDQVIGQEHVTRTLQNALTAGRLAQGFLFAGTRGVGKTSVARILAKAINCLGPIETAPCNECQSCRDINDGRAVDVQEIDGASHTGVDNVRELRDNARYLPANSKRKVYIIDEVHMLSKGAFNALLKTLEEPPEHVVFIFATTEVHKVPATILSRCQRFDFRPVAAGAIARHLLAISQEDGLNLTEGAAALIARSAKGSLRDSLSLLDQTIAFAGTEVTEQLVQDVLGMIDPQVIWNLAGAIVRGDTAAALGGVREIADLGHDWRVVYNDLINHFRNLIVLKVDPQTGGEALGLSEPERAALSAQAEETGEETLQSCLHGLLETERLFRTSGQPRFAFELAVLKLAATAPVAGLSEIIARLDHAATELDDGGASGPAEDRPAPSAPPQATPASPPPTTPTEASPAPAKPTPEPDPEPNNDQAEPTGGEGLDPVANWPTFLEELKRTKPTLAFTLGQSKPIDLQAGQVTLRPSNGFDFLADSGRRKQLEKAATAFFGRPLTFRLAEADQKKNRIDPEKQKLERQALDHPLIRAAMDIFGGRPDKVTLADKEN